MVAPPPHHDAAPSPVFPVAAGLQAGLTASQLRGPRFDAPHHGLRHTAGGQPSLADVVRALQRTNPGTAATHATAARLWEMWLPRQWERGPIHLARTRAEGGAPRRSGVVGHELHPQDPVLVRARVRITTPAATWAALAQLGRNGVPVYVVYRQGRAPVVLSEVLGVDEVRSALSASL